MRLIHFSEKPFTGPVKSEKQTTESWYKPDGFWVSDESNGDGWTWWCEAEGFRLEHLTYETEVELAPDANILYLKTPDEIRSLELKYGKEMYPGSSMQTIDWKRVAEEYQGIIITPYQWESRFEPHWYYPWDCASGCIWDAKAIARLGVSQKRAQKEKEEAT